VRLFTFDRAVLTEMMSANGPLTGGAHIRLSGLEFSMADTTMSASIDATQQRTTSWSSATSVRIELCAGTGAEPVVTLTIAQLVASAIGAFSYDGPVLSALQPMNAASSSKHISLHGLNFGRMQNASAAVCATIGWTALSTLVCSLSSGALQQQLQQHNFALTMDILIGTEGVRTLSFDAPVLSHARAINVPTCAGASLTLVGTNFGEWDATSSARTTAHDICATLSWTSVTTAACGTSGVSDRQNMLALTVSTTVGSGLALLSFDAPVLTQMAPLNSPTSGPVGPLASAGLNFRQADLSFSVRIGASLCASSAWSSATSVRTNACFLHVVGFPTVGRCFRESSMCDSVQVRCYLSQGVGGSLAAVLLSGASIGTSDCVFSFDAPAVSLVDPNNVNAPASGRSPLLLSGMNFGTFNATTTTQHSDSSCNTVSWTSSSALRCESAVVRLMAGTSIIVTVAAIAGTRQMQMTFDAPLISRVGTVNGPVTGGVPVQLQGVNFLLTDNSITAAIGQTLCRTVSWSSSTSLLCHAAQGIGTADALVTVAGVVGSRLSQLTFDAPSTSGVICYNQPWTYKDAVTVSGLHFAEFNASLSVQYRSGGMCATVSWSSRTQVRCQGGDAAYAPPYFAPCFAPAAILTVGTLVGTAAALFSFDAPVATASSAGYASQAPCMLVINVYESLVSVSVFAWQVQPISIRRHAADHTRRQLRPMGLHTKWIGGSNHMYNDKLGVVDDTCLQLRSRNRRLALWHSSPFGCRDGSEVLLIRHGNRLRRLACEHATLISGSGCSLADWTELRLC
jgi:hypothetical protein